MNERLTDPILSETSAGETIALRNIEEEPDDLLDIQLRNSSAGESDLTKPEDRQRQGI
jgi:hypothetical protein